jgi:hypothetical protein
MREAPRERGLLQRRDPGAAAEDEALEQRVRGEAIRAVHSRAGALAGRVETVDLGAPVEVGDDAAHGVVGGRRDRDRLPRGIAALGGDARHDRREAGPVDRPQVEQRGRAGT